MGILKKIKKFIHDATTYRKYKQVDGVGYVKERGRDWEPLMEHLEREHPKGYKELKAFGWKKDE